MCIDYMKKGKNLFRYNVTLDPKVIEEVKKIMGNSGRKLSPVINNLLIKWIEENQ